MIVNNNNMPWPLVSTNWLTDSLEAPDLRIIDCAVMMHTAADGSYTFAGAHEAYDAGHIPGAGFIDVLTELSDPDSTLPLTLPKPAAFEAVMSGLGVGPGTRVVLYDRSNHAWAARVWWLLRAYGFDTASVLDGGWLKWTAEQRPVSREVETQPAARFTADFRATLIARKADVLQGISDPGTSLINALSPEEHSGAQGRFERKGRIAGSSNVYCQSLIDPQTCAYRDSGALRAAFADSGAFETDRTITYCGGGIAASSDALILTALGVENVAVYDGSLNEWTRDPAAPMEVD
ncbi:MAG: sulfurtransferase [Gammaproteobacteria bacterium]|jgi:thiosulfate/3-mercaptopyruvate sulfurtransferase